MKKMKIIKCKLFIIKGFRTIDEDNCPKTRNDKKSSSFVSEI